MKKLFNIIFALLFCLNGLAQLSQSGKGRGTYYVSGIVRDSLTLEPVAYASVATTENAVGALADENGIFELSVPDKAHALRIACLGFEKKEVPIAKGKSSPIEVLLKPTAMQLKEVVAVRKKYTKKGNPAVEFMKRIKDNGYETDPRRNSNYNYNKYELMTLAVNDFAGKDENSALFKKFPFLWEHVDTSEVSGKPILNVMVKERASEVHYRKTPESEKEIVTGIRQEGIDEILDQGSMMTFVQDVLREVDLYENDINILQNRFVSPLSRIAPDFYRFYLTDTVEVGGEKCISLSFYPRNTATFGFNGQVFVPVADSTMFIKKATMRVPSRINLNFIEGLFLSQEFEKAPDGSRLKIRDDMTIEIKIAPATPGLYLRRSIAYTNHSFEESQSPQVFSELGSVITHPEAKMRDEAFWRIYRTMPISDNEKGLGSMMARLRQVPLYYWTEKFLKIMFTGYVNTGNPSKFDYGPVNTSFSHNDLEGWRFRAGGMTTANLSKRLFGRGYVAYGLKDHKWKYKAEAEYSFVDKEYHSREFPMHALRATSMYDVYQIGQQYAFTNADNIFLSWKRLPDRLISYQAINKLEYILELANNFSVNATVAHERQIASEYVKFVDGYGQNFQHYNENVLEIELRYAPGEKYYQTKSYRIPINLDAPVFVLKQRLASKNVLGSKYGINSTELSVQKRFWFSAFGFIDIIAKGGHVWSQSPFISLLIPNANLSYTIQPESYALMNPMEFVNDSYGSLNLTYWANGAILNFIPLVKKLKLREAFAFRALWGHLSDKNRPDLNPNLLQFPDASGVTLMSKKPYMEASVGLDNIFKCLRVDYVWRLSYLGVPYKIDKRGLRIAVHVTF